MQVRSTSAFLADIGRSLASTGAPYETDVRVSGLSADFLIQPSTGPAVVIEAKHWQPSQDTLQRAEHYAASLKAEAEDHDVILVLPGEAASEALPPNVVTVDKLSELIKRILGEREGARRPRAPGETPLVVASMPFSEEYDDVYLVAMTHAVREARAALKRIDEEHYAAETVGQFQKLVDQSVAVIADLSEGRPNVMYEVGYAHALRKPTVHISSTPLADLPFNVRNWPTMPYEKGRTSHLREPLAKRLKSIMGV